MQEFSAMARKAGICEATTDEVSNNADDDAYDQVRRPANSISAHSVAPLITSLMALVMNLLTALSWEPLITLLITLPMASFITPSTVS